MAAGDSRPRNRTKRFPSVSNTKIRKKRLRRIRMRKSRSLWALFMAWVCSSGVGVSRLKPQHLQLALQGTAADTEQFSSVGAVALGGAQRRSDGLGFKLMQVEFGGGIK